MVARSINLSILSSSTIPNLTILVSSRIHLGCRLFHRNSVDLFALVYTFDAQTPEMVEDGLPRWKVGGEIAPWAAGAQHVEDRIENGPQRVNWRSATFGQGREITLQALPLRIRKIAGITCTHLSSLSCEAISAINKTRSQIIMRDRVPEIVGVGTRRTRNRQKSHRCGQSGGQNGSCSVPKRQLGT